MMAYKLYGVFFNVNFESLNLESVETVVNSSVLVHIVTHIVEGFYTLLVL